MAGCVAHAHRGSRWTPQDSDDFTRLCVDSMKLVTGTHGAQITPRAGIDPVPEFKAMLNTLGDFFAPF